ncbi:MAG: hypothetical protein MUF64_14335 [Polyangiaceae bacterium]|jgi:hypothetical protein|nr:hypothetical protein [Polyangiaceae bacterium]
MKIQKLFFLGALASLVACSGGREVEVKGEVKAPTGSAEQAVLIEFYDVPGEGAEEKKVDTLSLEKAGAFSKKVSLEGDRVRVFALMDTDKDGKCSAGEAWATRDVSIQEDDTVAAAAVLELKATACPR